MIVSVDQALTSLEDLLQRAQEDGGVRIRRGDGNEFILKPAGKSALDVPGVKLDRPLTADEIVAFVGEGRERDYR